MLSLSAISLLFCGGLLVYGSGRGLDLTDEIFYLVWTRDPRAYALIYQPFGYLLNPLFKLVDGNLQTYRLTGFAIAAIAGGFLGLSIRSERRNRALFSLYGAACALTIFFPWIITPNYNSAADVGAMLIIAGILNAFHPPAAHRAVGAIAAAAGLCVAAFSKPPLFAIGAALVLVAACLARNARTAAALLGALVLAAALMSLFLAPAQIAELVGRILITQHLLAMPNTPWALPAKLARDWTAVPPALTGAAVAAALSIALRRSRWSEWTGYAAVALSFLYVCTIVADATEGSIPDFIGLAVLTTAAGYAGVLQTFRHGGLLVGLLLGAPLAVALGTFNNQWFQLNFSMAFPFLAMFVLATTDHARWRRASIQALCIFGPPALLLLAAEFPYSLPASIFDQQIPIAPPLAGGSILVDPQTATFVRSARGFAPGVLLIDLSGTGPGVGAALRARPPVLPWLNPATGNWPDVVWSRLSVRERAKAWFVGPVWPAFGRSAPALWLRTHKAEFCRKSLPPMTFWGEQRILDVWRPCIGGGHADVAPGSKIGAGTD